MKTIGWARYNSQNALIPHTQFHLLLLLFLLFASGCDASQPPIDAVPSPLPAITVENTPQDAVIDETLLQGSAERQLVIWAPAFFQPSLDLSTNGVLATVYEQFERNHPGVHIDVQIRADSGEAGLLGYLRSAQQVAPAILPDIILIDTQQLWQVADLEILLPIDWQKLGPDVDFYPFAVNAVTANGQFLGVPYTTDPVHLLYYPEQLSMTPHTWEEFLATEQPLIFVAGKSENLNEFAYLQYLGAGGTVSDTESLDGDALLAFFTFLAGARTQALISDAVFDIATVDAAWEAFAATDRGMVETSTRVVLQHWDMINSGTVQYTPLLTRDGTERSVARVWAFVIVASDVSQQELSLTLLRAFLHPTVHSQWSRVTMQVPTQPAAFELWRSVSPYYDFVQNELAVTQAFPYGRRFADLGRRLQNAQELVLRKEMTPEEATLYIQSTP